MKTILELTIENGLSDTQHRTMVSAVTSACVNELGLSPRQGIICGSAFAQAVIRVLHCDDMEYFEERFLSYVEEATIDGEAVEDFDSIAALISTDYIVREDDRVLAGNATIKILSADKRRVAPVPAVIGIDEDNRVQDYGVRKDYISDLAMDALNVLEETQSTKSVLVEGWVNEVYSILEGMDTEKAKDALQTLKDKQYVINGVAKMVEGVPYVTEFKFDARFRMYQVAHHGYNGQASDLERAYQDLHGVDTDYDAETVMPVMLQEIEDMTSLTDMDLGKAISYAGRNPVKSLVRILLSGDDSKIKKPWNFVKFSYLYAQIANGEKPYLGIAAGFDAKCSGLQIAGFFCDEPKILKATGLSTAGQSIIDDAYILAAAKCREMGIKGMTRSAIKKSVMANLYGAGAESMLSVKTIEAEAFGILYGHLEMINENTFVDEDEALSIAERYHRAISASFGTRVGTLRREIKALGVEGFGTANEECKLDRPIVNITPDGCTVKVKNMIRVNVDNEVINPMNGTMTKDVSYTCGSVTENMRGFKLKTKEYDLPAYARTGFVHLVHTTDALLARLIIVHCRDLGIKNVVSIHDCFRVSVTETHLLLEAIKSAYKELFGTAMNRPTKYIKGDLDITRGYLNDARNSTKEEFKNAVSISEGMFYANKRRVCTKVFGKEINTLFDSLGLEENNTFFFGK